MRYLPFEMLKKSQSCLHEGENDNMNILHSFFLRPGFVPMGFIGKVFNETVIVIQKNIVLFFLH